MRAPSEDERARDEVRKLAEQLSSIAGDDPMVPGEEILRFKNHRSARVRQAVAEASEHLPEPLFEVASAALLVDADAYVQRAAQRAVDKRVERRKTRMREDADVNVVREGLARLTDKHGKSARRLAEKISARATEYFVRRLHHELTKIVTPLETSLHRLSTGLDKANIDTVTLKREAETARDRLRFLWSVVDSARETTTTIAPTFREERLASLVDVARDHLVDRSGALASRIDVHNEVEPSLMVEVDRHRLLQAFQNILENAIQAYPADAERRLVLVTAKGLRHGTQVVLSFTDRGPGIQEDVKANMFVPFSSQKPGGAGMGLVIVRKMVEEVHGGALAIESAAGKGTTIKVTLPARQASTRRP